MTPTRVMTREYERRMTIYCDGRVPVSELDRAGANAAATVPDTPLVEAWSELITRRRALRDTLPQGAPELRTIGP